MTSTEFRTFIIMFSQYVIGYSPLLFCIVKTKRDNLVLDNLNTRIDQMKTISSNDIISVIRKQLTCALRRTAYSAVR